MSNSIKVGEYLHKVSGKIVTVVGFMPFRFNNQWIKLVAYKTSIGRLCLRTKEDFNEWFKRKL